MAFDSNKPARRFIYIIYLLYSGVYFVRRCAPAYITPLAPRNAAVTGPAARGAVPERVRAGLAEHDADNLAASTRFRSP